MTTNADMMDQQPQPQGQSGPPAEIREMHDTGFMMPVLSIQEAQRRFNALKQFVRENMRKDVDYGVIPGTGDKPTLLKPGAEKLCTFFGLRSQFEIIEHTQDWERGFFNYWYKCRLFRGGECLAEGEGSANSFERKYRWRTVPTFKATDEERARAIREETRRSRDGRVYKLLVLENDDPYTLVNTLQKMAQKRALIAATLIAVNASEFFTQDIEDMVVEADLEAASPEFRPGAAAQPEAPRAPEGEAPAAPAGENRGGERDMFDAVFEGRAEAPAGEALLTLKFKERPSQDTLQTLKGAGFRWNSKKAQWEAAASPDRRELAEELARTHQLAA